MDVRHFRTEKMKALAPPVTEFECEDRRKSSCGKAKGMGWGVGMEKLLTITGEPGDGGL